MIVVIAIMVLTPFSAFAMGMAKMSLKVIDEDSKPVEGAQVRIHFNDNALEKDLTIGLTDSNGIFSASGSSSDGSVGGDVLKNGYYYSVFHQDFIVKKLGFWQPWDKQIHVVLRPIINPVPMYVRDRWIDIPAVGREIGFDLMKFDWVIPYGQGVQSDFIFYCERTYKDVDNFDATITLTFSRENDGIQMIKDDPGGIFTVGSRFRLSRHAPESGYQRKLVKRRSRGATGRIDDNSDDSNYYFRVRSEVDAEGKLTRAMYGKIRGDIRFDPRGSKTASIHFHYYLNPDYTRNLEFDIRKNLFSPLPKNELPIGLP